MLLKLWMFIQKKKQCSLLTFAYIVLKCSCFFNALQIQVHTHTLMFTILVRRSALFEPSNWNTVPTPSIWSYWGPDLTFDLHLDTCLVTPSWYSSNQNTQNWLDGHCHMWQWFCVSTWGCSAFSIDCPNKSQWREKEGMDGAGGGRDTHEWLADLCDREREGGRQTERGMKHHFMTFTSVLVQLRVTFNSFRTRSLLT